MAGPMPQRGYEQVAAAEDDDLVHAVQATAAVSGGALLEPATALSSPATAVAAPTLGCVKLAALTFFAVAGGPYGVEPLVRAGGARWAVLGLLVIPWVWSLPMAMMTAELSSAMPESGARLRHPRRIGTQANVWSGRMCVARVCCGCRWVHRLDSPCVWRLLGGAGVGVDHF